MTTTVSEHAARVLLVMIVVSLPFYGFPFMSVGIYPIRWDFLLIIAFVLTFLFWKRDKTTRIHCPKLFGWFAIFQVFLLLSITDPLMTGLDTAVVDSLTTWGQIALYSSFFVAVFHLELNDRWIRGLLRLYVLVAAGVAVFGIGQFVLANVFDSTVLYLEFTNPKYSVARSGYQSRLGFSRATSVFGEPRHFGAFLLTPFLVVLASLKLDSLGVFSRTSVRVVAAGVLTTGLVISLSASAFAVAILSIATLPFFLARDPRRILQFYLFTLVGICVGVVLLLASPTGMSPILWTLDRLTLTPYQIKHLFDFQTHIGGGLPLYIRAAAKSVLLVFEHPLVGVGLNRVENVTGYGLRMMPPFQLLLSIGLVGFSALVAFVGTFLVGLTRLRLTSPGTARHTRALLGVATLLVTVGMLKYSVGSRFNLANSWIWVELSLAGAIYSFVIRSSNSRGTSDDQSMSG